MATVYLRKDGWTDSSGIEVGSEYSEERRSLRPNQVFHPPSHHHFRSGLSMELDDSTWQLEQHELARCLIGYVADVRRFGSYLMQMHVNDLWHLEGSVPVYGRSKNHYVFLFERVGDMHRIVDNGPYAIQGALLIVDYWKPDLVLDRLIFDKMLVWVQLYGLPLECFTEEAGVRLGRAVGEVVKVDTNSLMPCNIRFLRLRVNCGRIGHTINACALSFEEAQWQLDYNLQDMSRRLHSSVMTQESSPMYSATIRANAHRPERRTTRIIQRSTSSHMEIPEEVIPPPNRQDFNLDADFAAMWEQDWDAGLQQGMPERSESPTAIVQRDGVPSLAFPPPHRLVESDVLSGLGQVSLDSVGELEVMWHQWEGHLSSMGIRPGQLVAEQVGELTDSPHQEQHINYGPINGPGQGSLLASTEDVIRAIPFNGPGPRLNFPMGEGPITTRAFVRESPSSWTITGLANFEVGQSSSMMATGPHTPTVATALPTSTSSVSIVSGPSLRKRLREMEFGFDLLYDTEPMFVVDTVQSPFQVGSTELSLHGTGMVSDSMYPPQSLGSLVCKHLRRWKKAKYSPQSIMHGHAHAVPWLPREASDKFMPQRRRRKLQLRSHHLMAGTSSSMGSSSRRRRGQSSSASRGHRRGVSPTTGLLVQDVITSESGYDTGVSSPEGCGLGYEVSQTCAPADLVQVFRFGSSLGFKHHCGVDCNGRAGGLWVGWHDDILLELGAKYGVV
ncbi:hypothetical protein LOK49_LG15G00962 [Camellia lanceoleosa]|uniref:Uncharacterized protein n=1 Tax=Camellia lanceoleosa TaxID=1840588 RepID=A0ACC0F5Q1_9ERIC|nr:hypothetical protein LOK49_LG15G00962 [Camellia lanceoleosa]